MSALLRLVAFVSRSLGPPQPLAAALVVATGCALPMVWSMETLGSAAYLWALAAVPPSFLLERRLGVGLRRACATAVCTAPLTLLSLLWAFPIAIFAAYGMGAWWATVQLIALLFGVELPPSGPGC